MFIIFFLLSKGRFYSCCSVEINETRACIYTHNTAGDNSNPLWPPRMEIRLVSGTSPLVVVVVAVVEELSSSPPVEAL